MRARAGIEERPAVSADLVWVIGGLVLAVLLYRPVLAAGYSCEDLRELLDCRGPKRAATAYGPVWAAALRLLERDGMAGSGEARLVIFATYCAGSLCAWLWMRGALLFQAAAGTTFVLLLLAPGAVETFASVSAGHHVVGWAIGMSLCLVLQRVLASRGPGAGALVAVAVASLAGSTAIGLVGAGSLVLFALVAAATIWSGTDGRWPAPGRFAAIGVLAASVVGTLWVSGAFVQAGAPDETLFFGHAAASGETWGVASESLAHAAGAGGAAGAIGFVVLVAIVVLRRPATGIAAAGAAVAVLALEALRHGWQGAPGKGFVLALVFPLLAGVALASLRKTSLALFAALLLASAVAVQGRAGIVAARDRRVRIAAESVPQLPGTMPGHKVVRLNCPVEMRVLFRWRFGDPGAARTEDLSLLVDGRSPVLPRGMELDLTRPVVEFDGRVFRTTSAQDLLTRPIPPELWFVSGAEAWPPDRSPLETVLLTSRTTSFAREPSRFRSGAPPNRARAEITRVTSPRGPGAAPELEIEVEALEVVLLGVPALSPGAELRELGAARFGWVDPAAVSAHGLDGGEADGVRHVGWVDGGVAVFRCEPGKRRFRVR